MAAIAGAAAFDRPLVTNVHRGLLVEAIVSTALSPAWCWCAADYGSWDFEHVDGARLEVKQSAARQSWADDASVPSRCSFDIAPRTGYWEGPNWVSGPGRAAAIYLLAHHPIADSAADHRDPLQWVFYVVAAHQLPDTKRIAIASVRGLADGVGYGEVGDAVESVRTLIILRQQ